MDISSHAQHALALLHQQGFLRTSDLDTIGPLRVVLRHAKVCRVENVMRPYLKAVSHE